MGSTHLLFQTVFAKYRDHGDLRRDALQCSVDRRSSSATDSGKDVEGYKKLVEEMT